MDFKAVKSLAYLTQVAFLMLTPIIGGVFLGNFIDEKLHTSPWILLLCIVLGVATAFMSLYKFVMSVTRSEETPKEEYKPKIDQKQEDHGNDKTID